MSEYFRIGQLAQHLSQSYCAHLAAMIVANNPRASELGPALLEGFQVPVGWILRKDLTERAFHFTHYLKMGADDPASASEFERVWLVGSLLSLGDALEEHDYFDHAPELELVRHLRNAVAHGNRFKFTNRGLKRLAKYPAHNRKAHTRVASDFEITPALEGHSFLFNYMGPADVLDVLDSVSVYLLRIADGLPGHP